MDLDTLPRKDRIQLQINSEKFMVNPIQDANLNFWLACGADIMIAKGLVTKY